MWIYDVLTDPVLGVGNQYLLLFKTEYDSDVRIDDKANSMCSFYMPKKIEIVYSEQKEYYIFLNRNDEGEAIRGYSSINHQVELVNKKLADV